MRDLLMAWPMGAAVLAVLDRDRFAGARLADLAVQVLGAGVDLTGSEPELHSPEQQRVLAELRAHKRAR